MKPFREVLREVMEEENLTKPMATALARKAAEGDLRAMGMVMEALGENDRDDDAIAREWGWLLRPEYERMAR